MGMCEASLLGHAAAESNLLIASPAPYHYAIDPFN